MTEAQKFHGERIAARRAINGQPNGYRPVSESELQAEKRGQAMIAKLPKIHDWSQLFKEHA